MRRRVGFGLAAAGVAGVAGAGLAVALRRPLPKTDGALPLPGLSAPVQVFRDRWGVPHIYAATRDDMFTAQGFVHAQERLWQMEFQRRLAAGALSELFGELTLDTDRYMRILGFARVARREAELLDPETRAALAAYVRGVNAFLGQRRLRLPIECALLRHRPQPWEIGDVLLLAKLMALQLSSNWQQELLNARILAAVGEERAAALDPVYRADHPLIVPPGATYGAGAGDAALTLADAARRFLHDGAGQGSNSWAVAPARSSGGAALLANDPHLSVALPSVWFENHLSGGDLHVTGVSFPGAPGVVIGHNEQIAWGLTNGTNDVQDLYIERFDASDPSGLRYAWRDGWEQAERFDEAIAVRGRAEPHIERVTVTRHGPLLGALAGDAPTMAATSGTGRQPTADVAHELIALRWTALEPGTTIASILQIGAATSWESFRVALSRFTVPPQNVTYADVRGNIGYALAGRVPVRARGDGRLPVPGWSGEYEWIGNIPAADLPHAFNPSDGMVVTANNQIVGDEYPYPFPCEWLNGYRAARIRELLEQSATHDAETFARIHTDVRSLPGLELAALAARLPATSPLAEAARGALATWDGDLAPDSIGAAIYDRLRERLLNAVFAELGGALDLTVGIGGFAGMPARDYLRRSLPRVLAALAADDATLLGAGRAWQPLLAEIWGATLAELRADLGDDVTLWRYGKIHQVTLRHPLGAVPGLARIFNRGPFATGGDVDTVCMGHLPRVYAGAPFYVAPSYRQICDTGDWNRSQSIHATGQSGHPGSRRYDSFVRPWLRGQYHPMPWSRSAVEEVIEHRLRLVPPVR